MELVLTALFFIPFALEVGSGQLEDEDTQYSLPCPYSAAAIA